MFNRILTLSITTAFLAFLSTSCTHTNESTKIKKIGWENITTTGAVAARHEAGLINVDEKLYLLGGRRINPVNVYDTTTNKWQVKSKSPIEIHHFQPVVFDNEIYVIGAMTGKFPNETPLTNILIYNPDNDIWRTGDAIPVSRRRGGSGVSIYKNKIYISGGITHGHMTGTVYWFDEYNPETGQWKVLKNMPHGRDHFQSAIINNKLYAAGGRTTSAKTKQIFDLVVNHVDIYNFDNNTWTTTESPLPTGRAGNSTVAVNQQLWVIGGESATQQVAHNEVEIFIPKSKQWIKGAPLLRGRHGTGAVIVNDALWTVSGSGNQGGSPELKSLEKIKIR